MSHQVVNQQDKKIWQQFPLSPSLTLQNRLVMAPLTRCFADNNLIPTDTMAKYYQRRAECGLIITEGTIVAPIGQGYPHTPGIFNEAQMQGFKKITQSVKERGGKIFCQLWHVGRVSHADYHKGKAPFAPSAIRLEGILSRSGGKNYSTPKMMTHDDIEQTFKHFQTAAKFAKMAGFHGVEIHGANGYLVDQFLRQETNHRQDEFGGTTIKRARFALEVVRRVSQVWGSEHVGLRLAPAPHMAIEHVDGDEDTFIHLLEELNKMQLAYVHEGIFDDQKTYPFLQGRCSQFLRRHYKGNLIVVGNISIHEAYEMIENDPKLLVAMGRNFIANPNLVQRLKQNLPLALYNAELTKILF